MPASEQQPIIKWRWKVTKSVLIYRINRRVEKIKATAVKPKHDVKISHFWKEAMQFKWTPWKQTWQFSENDDHFWTLHIKTEAENVYRKEFLM